MDQGPIRTLVMGTDEVQVSEWALQLAGEAEIEVIGRARQAERAVHICQRQAPHAGLLCLTHASDLRMLAALLRDAPLPVVAISAAPALGVQALQTGATEVLAANAPMRRIIESLRLMSRVHVIRPKRTSALPPVREASAVSAVLAEVSGKIAVRPRRLVGIGASTGGPPVLGEILGLLPAPFPAPIVIAQHMPRDFHGSLAEWLGSATRHRVEVASQGLVLREGTVYLAPGDADLEIGPGGEARLRKADRPGPVPSVDTMFNSLARLREVDICGILLTGMGHDGATGLKALREAGALTLVQTRHSSTVPSMPESALQLDAADLVLAPTQMALELLRWSGASGRGSQPF